MICLFVMTNHLWVKTSVILSTFKSHGFRFRYKQLKLN